MECLSLDVSTGCSIDRLDVGVTKLNDWLIAILVVWVLPKKRIIINYAIVEETVPGTTVIVELGKWVVIECSCVLSVAAAGIPEENKCID